MSDNEQPSGPPKGLVKIVTLLVAAGLGVTVLTALGDVSFSPSKTKVVTVHDTKETVKIEQVYGPYPEECRTSEDVDKAYYDAITRQSDASGEVKASADRLQLALDSGGNKELVRAQEEYNSHFSDLAVATRDVLSGHELVKIAHTNCQKALEGR